MNTKFVLSLLALLFSFYSAFAVDAKGPLDTSQSLQYLPKGTRLVVKSDQIFIPPDSSGDPQNLFVYSSLVFVNGQLMGKDSYFLSESLPSPAVSCKISIEPANYERRLSLENYFATADVPRYFPSSTDPLDSSTPYFSVQLETPSSVQGTGTFSRKMRKLSCARSVNNGKFIAARYDITIADLQMALGNYFQVVLPEPTSWDPSAGTNPASTTSETQIAEIKPLAAVCNMNPPSKVVRSGPYNYDDSAGGFPSDRMSEACSSRGANSYQVEKVDTPTRIPYIGILGDPWKRNFKYYCLKNEAIPTETCSMISACRLKNVSSENISSIEHWLKAYSCK